MSLIQVLIIVLLFVVDFATGIVSVSLTYKNWEERKSYALPLSLFVLSIVGFLLLASSLFIVL